MATMTAALHDGKGTMRVSKVQKPVAGPGDAIIRVGAVGICGSDLLMNSAKTEPDKLPAGHEVAGEIVEVGEGVEPLSAGQRVAVESLGHGQACATCWYCRMGQFIHCQNKAPNEGGGFAQYMKRRAIGCYALPDSLSWEEAALVRAAGGFRARGSPGPDQRWRDGGRAWGREYRADGCRGGSLPWSGQRTRHGTPRASGGYGKAPGRGRYAAF